MRLLMRDGRCGVDAAFVDLPRLVYADDPAWIPEDEAAVHRAFSAENPWFASGRAMTVCVPGEARLAVFRDPRLTMDGRPAAFFGYWEERGHGTASGRLFAEAEAWARLHGAHAVYGPVNFSTLGAYRLRLGAEPGAIPFLGEPYNPPRYAQCLDALGFAVTQGYQTQVGTLCDASLVAKSERLRELRAAGYSFEALDADRWMALLPEAHRAADEIFGDAPGYTPVTFETFAAACGEVVARRLDPQSSVVARSTDGSLAGFVLVYPHYGPLAAQGAGAGRVSVNALSFAGHAAALVRIGERTGIVKTAGVMRAHRRRGLMDAMIVHALQRGRARYDHWIAAMIRDDNPSGRFGQAHPHSARRYALYGKRAA